MARYLDVPHRWRQTSEPELSTEGTFIVLSDGRVKTLLHLIEHGRPGDVMSVHPDRLDFWLCLPDYVTLRTYPDGEEIRKRLSPWDWACKLLGVPSQYRKKKPSERSKFLYAWNGAFELAVQVGTAYEKRNARHAATTDEPIPLDKMRAAPRLALDTEVDVIKKNKPMPTRDPILGVSIGWEDGECWIPTEQIIDPRTGGWTNLAHQLASILYDPAKTLIGHHAKFDEIVMHRLGFHEFKFDHDTMLLSYMHGGRYPAGLKKLIYALRRRPAQEIGPLIDRYGRVSNIPKATLIPYAKADARNTYDADEDLEKLPIDPMYDEIEMPISRLLCSMEEQGWQVDNSRLDQVESELEKAMEAAAEKLAPYGITSPTKNQEVAAFFIGEGFDLPMTQIGYSVDKDVLRTIDHPAVEHLLDYREAHKRATNWVRAMRRTQDERGYIHPNFRQAPVSGRLSCSNPNVQNYTYDIRSCLVPDPGQWLVAADMSQFEMRIMAKASGDPTLIREYLDNVDVHALNQAALHLPTRRAAKDTMYGIGYGLGEATLAANLTKKGEPTTIPEARAFMNSIYGKYNRLRPWKKEELARFRANGCIALTMAGRPRWLPELLFDDVELRGHAERAAVNHIIQGTAADLMKIGMLILEEYLPRHGARQLAQVHDEFVISTPNPFATWDALMVVMEEFQRWLDPVPVGIDVLVGLHWGFK